MKERVRTRVCNGKGKRKEKRDSDPKIEPHSSKLPRPKIKNRNLSNASWTLKGTGGLPPVEGRKMLAPALESTPNCSLHVRRPTIPNGNTRDPTRKDEQTGGTERRRITDRGSPRNPSARDPIIFCYNDSAARNGMAVAPPTIYAPKKGTEPRIILEGHGRGVRLLRAPYNRLSPFRDSLQSQTFSSMSYPCCRSILTFVDVRLSALESVGLGSRVLGTFLREKAIWLFR